jgi:hydrogenase maturation protease
MKVAIAKKQILVLGAGNILRSDDGLGPAAIGVLQEKENLPDFIRPVDVGTSILQYLEDISHSNCVIFIDAVRAGGIPGSVYSFDLLYKETFLYEKPDSHGFSPSDAVSWARILTGFPQKAILYGIEPANLEYGLELSLPVKGALPELIRLVYDEIRSTLLFHP